MEKPLESPELSYDPLNDYFNNPSQKILEREGYWVAVLVTNKDFIGFNRIEEPEGVCKEGLIFKKHGLKFHVSLPEYDPAMFKKGWDIVRNTLVRHEVVSFKVVRSGRKMSDTEGQEGKDVTIYADAEPSRGAAQWKIVLEDITNRLKDEGIKPGYRAPGTEEKPEKAINGSNYITYRYFDEKTKKSVWPIPDPCNDIRVNVKHAQPEIPVLNRQNRKGEQTSNQQQKHELK